MVGYGRFDIDDPQAAGRGFFFSLRNRRLIAPSNWVAMKNSFVSAKPTELASVPETVAGPRSSTLTASTRLLVSHRSAIATVLSLESTSELTTPTCRPSFAKQRPSCSSQALTTAVVAAPHPIQAPASARAS